MERLINSVRYRRQRDCEVGYDRSRVREFLNAHHTEAVLAEFGPMGCLLGRACNEAKVPLYVHFHGYDASELLRDARQVRHYRALFNRASSIIAPSRFLSDKLAKIGCPENKLHVSPCGVDVRRFQPSQYVGQRISAVGRLVEKKAPHVTIEAFSRIGRLFPEARLDMIGDGPLSERCRTLICQLGLSERVYMHGVQGANFVAQLMQKSVVFVQHSVTAANGDMEGLPVAILKRWHQLCRLFRRVIVEFRKRFRMASRGA